MDRSLNALVRSASDQKPELHIAFTLRCSTSSCRGPAWLNIDWWYMFSTEFLKGHLWFLPFTFYSINALLFTTSNLLFLPYTTFNLLFLFTILVLLFTIFNLLLFLPFYHFQFNITWHCTIYRFCFTIYHFKSTCTFIYFFIPFYLLSSI